MKTTDMRLLMMTLLMVLLSPSAYSQTAFHGRLYLSDETFRHDGQILRVHMKVSYGPDAVPACGSVVFTPILKNGPAEYRLPSSIVDGDRMSRTMHRSEVLGHYHRTGVATIVKDRKSGHRYFVYEATVPYEQWMKGGSLYSESHEQNNPALTCEDRLLTSIPFEGDPVSVADIRVSGSQLLSWVQYIDPSGTDSDIMTHTGIIPLYGTNSGLGKSGQNRLVYETLLKDINSTIQLYGTNLVSVRITGYGSPIGNHDRNEIRSMKRALSLKKYLMGNRPTSGPRLTASNLLDVSWISEDWDSIETLTRESGMSLKESACDIIRTVAVTGGRESVLEGLNGGIPYHYMRAVIFPKVHRISYTLVYNRKGVDAATGRMLMRRSPRSMSLTDFWNVSMSYDRGSREFNDALDLSARIFHDSPVANINAAAVALTRKDLSAARHYLNGLDTDPRAYNNYGILYLLEGNTDKAEVYLNMARAAGIPQAAKVLEYLKK